MNDSDLRMLDVPITEKTSFSTTTKEALMSQWRKEVVVAKG